MQGFASVPTMLDRCIARGLEPRVKEQGTSIERKARAHAVPV
jgi:hypothetical protein